MTLLPKTTWGKHTAGPGTLFQHVWYSSQTNRGWNLAPLQEGVWEWDGCHVPAVRSRWPNLEFVQKTDSQVYVQLCLKVTLICFYCFRVSYSQLPRCSICQPRKVRSWSCSRVLHTARNGMVAPHSLPPPQGLPSYITIKGSQSPMVGMWLSVIYCFQASGHERSGLYAVFIYNL